MSETSSQTVATVTIAAVRTAARACREASKASKANQEADGLKKRALMALFEPLLGIKTSDELGSVSPEQLKRKITARTSSGAVTLEGIDLTSLIDAIQKTQVRRPVQWKEEFTAILGEARAAAVAKDPPERFSYTVTDPA